MTVERCDNGVVGRLQASDAETGELDLDVPAAVPFTRLALRSPGRPKGATNRRVAQMRDTYLRMGYTHPMIWMGEVLGRSVQQLASDLGCEQIEALDVQRKVAAELMPYLESKMPTMVEATASDGVPVLIVGEIKAAAPGALASDGDMAIDDDLAAAIASDTKKNQ